MCCAAPNRVLVFKKKKQKTAGLYYSEQIEKMSEVVTQRFFVTDSLTYAFLGVFFSIPTMQGGEYKN